MSSWMISCLALLAILTGMLIGSIANRRLPKKYFRSESKDVVKSAATMIATLAALVSGLLVASTKSSYDAQEGQIKQIAANIVLLDQLLEQYGPEAKAVRQNLRLSIPALADRIWNSGKQSHGAFEISPEANTFLASLQTLSPSTNAQRIFYARAIESVTAIGQARIQIFSQTRDQLAAPFVIILIFWLSIVFASFTLFARLDALSAGALLLSAFACAAAIFLILEMNDPLTGLMSISSAPFRESLAPLN